MLKHKSDPERTSSPAWESPTFACSLDLATHLTPPGGLDPGGYQRITHVHLNFTNQGNLPQAFYRLRFVP